jgi:DnaJ-class molecular chaperone
MNEQGIKILGYSFFLFCGICIGFIVRPMVIDKEDNTNDPTEITNEFTEEITGDPTDDTAENPRQVFCPRCDGGGNLEKLCRLCSGTGYLADSQCPDCSGVGRGEETCDVCYGSGKVDENLVH